MDKIIKPEWCSELSMQKYFGQNCLDCELGPSKNIERLYCRKTTKNIVLNSSFLGIS